MQKRKILRKSTKANQAYTYLLRSFPEGSVREVREFSGEDWTETRSPKALTHEMQNGSKKRGREAILPVLEKSTSPVGTRMDASTHALYAKRFLNMEYVHPSLKKALALSITERVKSLERRLDTLVYKAGFARTIAEGKQKINHQYIVLNHTKINLPSVLLQPGDLLTCLRLTTLGGSSPPRTHVLEVDGDTAIYLFHPYQAEYTLV